MMKGGAQMARGDAGVCGKTANFFIGGRLTHAVAITTVHHPLCRLALSGLDVDLLLRQTLYSLPVSLYMTIATTECHHLAKLTLSALATSRAHSSGAHGYSPTAQV